jgi:hypothetical protein
VGAEGTAALTDYSNMWEDRSSIYAHLRAHIRPGVAGLLPGAETLPDEKPPAANGDLGWAPGALDGITSHHGTPEDATAHAEKVTAALLGLAENPSDDLRRQLYGLLSAERALGYLDPLAKLLTDHRDTLDDAFIRETGQWLATEAPDREPVKVGMGLLTVAGSQEDAEVVLTLGRHSEFTALAVVAIQRFFDPPDRTLMELGEHVDGWGRIHIIGHLEGTSDPEVQRWMLRKGFRNSIMNEYTAYTCATTGRLIEELSQPEVDDELLSAATDLVWALVRGGPARDIGHYNDGLEVVQRYLNLVRRGPAPLKVFLVVDDIRSLLRNPGPKLQRLERVGWTPDVRESVSAECDAILAEQRWNDLVNTALAWDDDVAVWHAVFAAEVLGIDAWETCLRRVAEGKHSYWSRVFKTKDRVRVEKALKVAEEVIPLDEITCGAPTAVDRKTRYIRYGAIDNVLAELQEWPGLGWPIIWAGLRSPWASTRGTAAWALSAWQRDAWTEEMCEVVQRALSEEPDPDVLKDLDCLLAGEPLSDDDGWDEEPD